MRMFNYVFILIFELVSFGCCCCRCSCCFVSSYRFVSYDFFCLFVICLDYLSSQRRESENIALPQLQWNCENVYFYWGQLKNYALRIQLRIERETETTGGHKMKERVRRWGILHSKTEFQIIIPSTLWVGEKRFSTKKIFNFRLQCYAIWNPIHW